MLLLGAGRAQAQRTLTPIVEVPVGMAPIAGAAAAVVPTNNLTLQALGTSLPATPIVLSTVLKTSRAHPGPQGPESPLGRVLGTGGFHAPAGVAPLAQALERATEADGATGQVNERANLLDQVIENRAAATGSADRDASFLRELNAPDQGLGRHGITRTIVVYGSARTLPPDVAAERLAAAQTALAAKPKDRALRNAVMAAHEATEMSKYYGVLRRFGALVSEKTLGQVAVVTGGGGGIMEAANRGATEAGGPSVGYNIHLPNEQGLNRYVTPGMSFEFDDFSTRKKGLRHLADAHVYGPGGFGTLDEFFEVLTLIQTGKLPRVPVVMIGSKTFWKDVVNVHALARRGMISPQDIKLISFVETEDEAWRVIAKFYHDQPEYAIEGRRRHPGGVLFQKVFDALEKAAVRYVVVGGHAVRFHGHNRLTPDLDVVVDLEPEAARRAVDALTALGLKPRVPVDPKGFADPAVRRAWEEEKNMLVFSFYDPKDPLIGVDVFVKEFVPFAELYAGAELHGVGGTPVRVASIDHIVRMKQIAGRPQDQLDIHALQALRARK